MPKMTPDATQDATQDGHEDGPAALAAFFAEHLPLAGAMRVAVVAATPERVSLRFPLGPNLNHHGTAFGGSLAAAGILAGWSLLHLRLRHAGEATAGVVVGDSRTRFRRPVETGFTAVASLADGAVWDAFLADLRKAGRGRLAVKTLLVADGESRPAAVHEGLFVAVRTP